MNKISRFAMVIVGAALSLSGNMMAAAPTDYQVTGPVLEVTDTTIVVQKGKDRWELAKDAATKSTGEVKVGAKVTVHYTMTAQSIEAKADKAAAKTASKAQ